MRRFISILLLLVVLIPSNVFALQNENYYKGISIGLRSMASTSFEVTLNGDYYYNGQLYKSGKVFNVTYSSNAIMVDELLYTNEEFVAVDSTATMKIFSTSKNTTRNYRGNVKFTTYLSDAIPVVTLDMEEYLYGVVPYEMPSSYNIEALKAQAIAARTYAIKNFNKRLPSGYNLDDTTACQVFKGSNDSLTRAISAVDSTKGIIMTYNNVPIDALYSASDGGYTDKSSNVWSSDFPYFIALADPFDTYSWTTVMSKEEINEALKSKGYIDATLDSFDSIDINTMTFFESGRASSIEFTYINDKGDLLKKSLIKDLTRTFLGFKSSMYTVVFDSNTDTYTFNGKGYGHGIGLSQMGANSRANAGQNYVDILKFYYSGIQLQNTLTVLSTVNVSPQYYTNEPAVFTATAENGSGKGHLFKFVVKQGERVISDSGYLQKGTYNFTHTAPGAYKVDVMVKDTLSSKEYEDIQTKESIVNVTYSNVAYNSNGGSSIKTEAVRYDTLPKKPVNPLKNGFTFLGWYKEIEKVNSWNFLTDYVNKDVILYAKWKPSLPESLNYEKRVSYINGYESGEFKPSGNITRAEASKLFYNLLKDKTIEKDVSFSDLSPNIWYYDSMITLSSKGKIAGYIDGTIKAEESITRAEFVTLVSRFTELATGERTFTDLSSSDWAYKYVVSAAEKGWIDGYEDGSFKPNDNITRAEAVKIINSMLGRVIDKEELENATGLKYFTDVSNSHWAYNQIIDAANSFSSK